jgi:murein L,D-transpeptidase YcbB/YkuD
MAKKSTKKTNKPAKLARFSQQQVIVALLFVLAFTGFGAYRLAVSDAASPCVNRLFRKGSRRDVCVGYIQTMANTKNVTNPKLVVDNLFGGQTKRGVIQVQASNRLTQDGIVGPKTWRALCTNSNVTANAAWSGAGCSRIVRPTLRGIN